jgi:hypothetical protein
MTGKEKELLQEMLATLNKIKTQTDYIDTHERIPQLELDAIVSRVEKLYELSVALKYFHAHVDEMLLEKQQMISETLLEEPGEPVHEEEIIEVLNETEVDPMIESVEESIEEVVESLSRDISSITTESAHDKLSNNEDESVVNRLMLQPIADLKLAIGINDKFQFINELFGGDADTFNNKIEILNIADNMTEAQAILLEYSWDENNEVAKSFLTLLERRYL